MSISKLLPFFDPNELPNFPFIFILGSRRAGKSTLVCDLLLNYFSDYDLVIGLMGNPHTARQYTQNGAIPGDYVHTKYSPKILKEWFKKADKLLKKGHKLPRTLFVLDDILKLHAEKGGITTRRDPYLMKLATAGRHYSAAAFFCCQSASLTLGFARNSDCVILSPSSLYAGQDFKAIAELYMTGDFKKENKELLRLFKQYDFLVLRYWKGSRSQQDLLSYYRVNDQSLQFTRQKSSVPRNV